ncbi:hypothetical protein EMIHUDRAFT_198775 [Emiliania huxleyi CCMP1516]|uniref:SET domain-containing protein n=2 Tax=Emiliania huxleyi TaxID=2903 RepID=A0A0D3I7U8_EMIH1|nr:hypothetical protein EMIHUDRAFT_198775 [Emiliania huxleyi CCMP1516]EOD07333.1 hypothetical protein EMIHUDRAFT_198775 [Emiliania huxleyi CCMP1516]|eukprot:XP_005759762.1 hypothetical protein EMIHUDRAFT_198775 [Emiliania huxleyi CCMP1516]
MIEVRDTDRAGRGVFAVRRLKAGTEVVRALPAAAAEDLAGDGTDVCVDEMEDARFFLGAHARLGLAESSGLAETSGLLGRAYCNSLTLYAPAEPAGDGGPKKRPLALPHQAIRCVRVDD